jgi:diguanylate cyclase (GGDEF)-like protein
VKILYVEDNAADIELTRRALTKQLPHMELVVAYTVSEAQRILADINPIPFDILLLDVYLPDGEGLDIIRYVRANGIYVATVLLTASGDEKTVIQAIKLGATDYLIKRNDYLERLPKTLIYVLSRFHTQTLRHNLSLTVLYAEHNSGDAEITIRYFKRHAPHIHMKTVIGGEAVIAALVKAGNRDIDVLLIDYRLVGMDALELIKELRDIQGIDLPTVLITSRGSEEVAAHALRMGVADYIMKDSGYLERLPYVLEHAHIQTELLKERARLEYLATYDGLTGLLNRNQFCQRASRAFERAISNQTFCALLMIDLDNFKFVNDSFGHPAGDSLLNLFAKRLHDCVREQDGCGRFGGDEFLVLLDAIIDIDQAARMAQRIAEALTPEFLVENQYIVLSASIGISIFPTDGLDVDTLIRNADTAMYNAKAEGRSQYRFFTSSMNERVEQRFKLEADLRRALERGEFSLVFQPQFNLKTLAPTGFEALLRWRHPKRGLISPDDFIPVAEQCGLILPIGQWVLREACRLIRAWLEQGQAASKIAVNVSAKQFRSKNFIDNVTALLAEFNLNFDHLEIELTESVMADDIDHAQAILQELKAIGAHISVDDFGTGYSSLAYLKRFPITTLKIDRSFVRDITTDPEDAAIATAIINLAHTLGMTVVAEGVETWRQLEFLKQRDCDRVQGFLLSMPLAADDVIPFLREWNPGQHFRQLETSLL